MARTKADILDMFHELSELTILEEGDPASFRVRAYESAARAVDAYAGDITALTAAKLQALEGIGKSSAGKIRELLDTGKVDKLEDLRKKHPPAIVALLSIPGLGPKAVNRLRKELGVQGLDDLKRVIAEHKLRDLKGFGQKSEDKIAQALARMQKQGTQGRTPISVALPLAERILATIKGIAGVRAAAYCGSLRRFAETIGDLDFLVAADDPARVMDTVVALSMVDQVLGRGETKTSVVTRRGLQIDVRVVKEEELGAALMYFTGSKAHNVKMRQRALARGLTLNEYALTEIATGKVVAARTEEEVYAALGLPWIPPHLREDTGEIELAEQNALPAPVPRILGDFHVHTTVSGDGKSSLEEQIAAARARGVKVLAITEHAEGTVSGVDRAALLAQREKIAALRAELGDALVLLHGVELNIGPEGQLDYDAEFRRGFDFCLASIHDHFDLPQAAQTARVVAAMRDPDVRMIGHLTARMIGARPGVDLDYDAIFAAAEETGTALEINGGLPRLDLPVDVVRRARDRKIDFVLCSDAHHTSELDRVENAAKVAEKAWLPVDKIVNTWEPARLAAWARGG